MEQEGKDATKLALQNVRESPYYFAYAPSVVLTPKPNGKANGRPEAVLVVDKNVEIKPAGFAAKVLKDLQETVKVNPSLLIVGKIRKVKQNFVLEVNTSQSKGTLDAAKAQKILREFGKSVRVTELTKSILSTGEISDTDAERRAEQEPPEPEETGGTPEAPTDASARYTAALERVEKLLTQLPEDSPLRARVKEAKDLAGAEKPSEAANLLEEVEGLAASAIRAKKESDAAIQSGGTAFARSRVAWSQARDIAKKEIRKLQITILKHPPTQKHPSFPTVMNNVQKMGALLDRYGELDEVLDRAAAARDAAAQKDARTAAKTLLGSYRAQIKGNALLSVVDDNPYVKVAVFSTLTTTLDAIDKLLG